MKVPLIVQQQKYNLSDEEVINRFFTFIKIMEDDKDYYINDFEDFYFRTRPKLSSKTVKIFLEVRTNLMMVFRERKERKVEDF